MAGVVGHRNYPEEEGKGKGHKFLRLFCDLVLFAGLVTHSKLNCWDRAGLFPTEGCSL